MAIARLKSLQANWFFLSGSAGRQAMTRYAALLRDLDHEDWRELNLSRPRRFEIAMAILKLVAQVWRRLVFKMQVPKYQIFEAVVPGSGFFTNCHPIVENIRGKHELCRQCVDPHFSLPWALRLGHPLHGRAAVVALGDVLALSHVMTGNVERKHLVGQEGHGAKKRGRRMLARTLSKRTCVRSAQASYREFSDIVLKRHVGPQPNAARRFCLGLARARVMEGTGRSTV